MNITEILCKELSIKAHYAENVIKLIDEGNTIPFIARYRKELTGSMDDQLLREFSDRLEYLRNLDARRGEILKAIEEQGKLTDELASDIQKAETLAKLEDLYRPYKQKRKTRASIAKEKGLEPFAEYLLAQKKNSNPMEEAQSYITEGNESIAEELWVATVEDAIKGAQDIIAEKISDDALIRSYLRDFIIRTGKIACSPAKEEDSVYSMYYEYEEPAAKLPSHRILAIDRGEKEGFLKVNLTLEKEAALEILNREYVKGNSPSSQYIEDAVSDSFDRLLFPSMERELRNTLSEKASESAIGVFSENLKNLLMQPPVAGKVTLGVDPAYRTGCKLAIIDGTGLPLATDVIYPTPPQNKVKEAEAKVLNYIKKFNIEIIAIGNGTASKESEIFIADTLKKIPNCKIAYMVVNEAGASVYSASKLAATEFPDYDVSLRSAVSIARRLQDPLAELVKIEPKAIGVGQYQHDMPKARLENALGGVVEDCVNKVGVDLNTASPSLLSYIAGITQTTAKNIVKHREENGRFKARKELLKVSKLGPKAFEQCAGFLRIPEGTNVLDRTGVHPESYKAAEGLLKLCGYTSADVIGNNLSDLKDKVNQIGHKTLAEELNVGSETLTDIIKELMAPGRDPRADLPQPLLRTDVMTMEDLTVGMELTGTVRNVIDFGAFVDIGVHHDGLVHISQICNRFIKHPSEELKVGDIVKVHVLEIDKNKGRISLTMKGME